MILGGPSTIRMPSRMSGAASRGTIQGRVRRKLDVKYHQRVTVGPYETRPNTRVQSRLPQSLSAQPRVAVPADQFLAMQDHVHTKLGSKLLAADQSERA